MKCNLMIIRNENNIIKLKLIIITIFDVLDGRISICFVSRPGIDDMFDHCISLTSIFFTARKI